MMDGISLCRTLAIGAFLIAGVSNVARATPLESLVRLAPRPAGSNVVALAWGDGGNGLIYSRDGGETFATLCTDALSAEIETSGGTETMHVGTFEKVLVMPDGRLMVGDFYGLWMDDGQGCNWQLLPDVRRFVTTMVHDPIDPEIMYFATASGGQLNGVFRRNPDGTFDPVGEQSEPLIWSLKVVALGDGGRRFYKLFVVEQVQVDPVTGMAVEVDAGEIPPAGTRSAPSYRLQYSDDEGESWQTHDLGFDPGLGSYRIAAVDPTDPDRIVFSVERYANGGAQDSLLVSEDRGATLREWHRVLGVSDVVFGSDGQVWIGDRGEGTVDPAQGLWHASSVLEAPELVTDDYRVACLELRDGELELCGKDRFGVVDLETGELDAKMTFSTLETVHSCPGVDVAMTCERSLCNGLCKHWSQAPYCAQYRETVPSCGGAPSTGGSSGSSDAGDDGGMTSEPMTVDASPVPAPSDDGGCSCRVAGGAHQRGRAAVLAAALLALVLGARRAARRDGR